MIPWIIGIVLLSQVLTLWYFLGCSWILVLSFGTVFGAFAGLFMCWLYSELRLLVQNLSKVDVTGKSVFITGCDSGFGLKLAESLVKKGMFVFAGVFSLDSNGANNLKSLSTVKVIKIDVTVDEDVKQAFEIVKQHLAQTKMVLWAVINIAGIYHTGMMEFTNINTVRRLIDVNALGGLRVCQTFSPLLRGHGRIVNLTSLAGTFLYPLIGVYCLSKYVTEVVSKTLRIEMYTQKISVITVQPGAYKTSFLIMREKPYGDEEVKVYGRKFMEKCEEILNEVHNQSSDKISEVIECLESAILNKKFQYSYIPNFQTRLLMLWLKCLSDEYITKNGGMGTSLPITTTLD